MKGVEPGLMPRRGRLGHGRLTISAASANVMLLIRRIADLASRMEEVDLSWLMIFGSWLIIPALLIVMMATQSRKHRTDEDRR